MSTEPTNDDPQSVNPQSSHHHAPSIPRRGCPPPTPEECQQRWAAWFQAMEFSHTMLMLRLRQEAGPDGDLNAAYRDWYKQYQALKWDADRAT